MKNLIIFGASGFGREVAWLVERINNTEPTWNLLGFLDDNNDIRNFDINGYRVLGDTGDIRNYSDSYFVCAVGASKTRERIINKMKMVQPDIRFATLVDPSVILSKSVDIGEGTIICAHSVLTVNIAIGVHVIINLDCTIGHDAVLSDYVTLYPSVNVSGTANIGRAVELGTGTQVIQGKSIGSNSIIGAGAVVVKDIPASCTAVGNPAKPISFKKV